MPPANFLASLNALLAAFGIYLLLRNYRRLDGMTLQGTWYWAVVSLFCLGFTELPIASYAVPSSSWPSLLRYLLALSTFCPVMSQIGAKRPQDKAWHFVVVSLWGVLAMPAIEAFFLGKPMPMFTLRSWFLWLLILIGISNTLPTRHWLAGLLFAAGQIVLLSPQLPLIRQSWGILSTMVATSLLVIAIWLIANRGRRSNSDCSPKDRLWLDFRDCYGTLWALRVAERFNLTARQAGWPVHLSWWGFRMDSENPLEESQEVAMNQAIRNLLRRFVAEDWFDAEVADTQPSKTA